MSILVSEERLESPSVEVVLNGQVKYLAVSDNGATVAELFNAVFSQAGIAERLVEANDDGTFTLDEHVLVLRSDENGNGSVLQDRTINGGTRVYPGDQVIEDRKHTNGS